MQDTIITAKVKKREIIIALCCVIVSIATNIVAIVRYETSWTEIFSQIGFVGIIALILYLVLSVFRLVVWLMSKLLRHRR